MFAFVFSSAILLYGFMFVLQDHIEKVLRVGVDPSRILYAHPCKQISAIKCAANNGVRKMCFDNEGELEKIKRISPDAEYVNHLVYYLLVFNYNQFVSSFGVLHNFQII